MHSAQSPNSLVKKTRELLHADTRSLPEIYTASGISFYWLRRFKSGNMRNPPADRVQHLYEFLSGKKLAL